MDFPNNAEMMGFEKAGWTRFFITPEKDGMMVILAGKTLKDNFNTTDPLWHIRITVIRSSSSCPGATDIFIENYENVSWDEYYKLYRDEYLMEH